MVDSGSADGGAEVARAAGARVIELGRQRRLRTSGERRAGPGHDRGDHRGQPRPRAGRRLARRAGGGAKAVRAAAGPGAATPRRHPPGLRAPPPLLRARTGRERDPAGGAARPRPAARGPVAGHRAAPRGLGGGRLPGRAHGAAEAAGAVQRGHLPVRRGPRPRACGRPSRASRPGSGPTRACFTTTATPLAARASASSCSPASAARWSSAAWARPAAAATTRRSWLPSRAGWR